MAHFKPTFVDDLITAANDCNIESLIESAFSMASQASAPSCSSYNSSADDDDEEEEEEEEDGQSDIQNRKANVKECDKKKTKIPVHQKKQVSRVNETKDKPIIPKMAQTSKEMNLTSDAHNVSTSIFSHSIKSQTVRYNANFCLNTQAIEEIEDDLQFYEKVSLVFLLYDSDDLALQRLKMAYRAYTSGSILHSRLLSDWALHEPSDNWRNKFLEALCIIKNKMWISHLGLSPEEMNSRFLPGNPEASLYVDLMRKALYIICESLTCEKLERLQLLVDKDMESIGRMPDRYDAEFMEMNVLHWMSQRYLNLGVVGSCDGNIKNLTKHLKVMEEFELVDYIESISRRCYKHSESISEPSLSDQISVRSGFSQGGISSHSVISQCQEENPIGIAPDPYVVDPRNVGFCVIINQKKFYKEPNTLLKHLVHEDYLESRIGTDVDRDRLCEIFMSFGFYVKIWENLTHIELVQAIHESATKLVKKEHSCFVLCILSHGKKNAVYGVNSIAVEMHEIEKLLHGKYCPNLLHKPKLIIVQACQGLVKQNAYISDIDTDGDACGTSSPEVSDTLTFWATVPGYAAFRDRITGSWFIRALWDEMLQKRSLGLDVLTTFVNVTALVCSKRAPIDGELKAMTPQVTSCFRKKLFLSFHHEARKAAAKRMFDRYLFDHLLKECIQSTLMSKKLMKKCV